MLLFICKLKKEKEALTMNNIYICELNNINYGLTKNIKRRGFLLYLINKGNKTKYKDYEITSSNY